MLIKKWFRLLLIPACSLILQSSIFVLFWKQKKKDRSNSTINGLETNIDQVEFGMTTRSVQFP